MPTIGLDTLADRAVRELGAVLVTTTVIVPDGTEVARVQSTHPQVYAVGDRKKLDPEHTSPAWMKTVVHGQEPFFGSDRAAVREFFVDWAAIERLGCSSIINTPVVDDGETIGSVNFLAPEGTFDQRSVEHALKLTAEAVPAVARARELAFPELAR